MSGSKKPHIFMRDGLWRVSTCPVGYTTKGRAASDLWHRAHLFIAPLNDALMPAYLAGIHRDKSRPQFKTAGAIGAALALNDLCVLDDSVQGVFSGPSVGEVWKL